VTQAAIRAQDCAIGAFIRLHVQKRIQNENAAA